MFFAPYYDTQEEYITFSQELHQPKIKIRQMDSHAGMNPIWRNIITRYSKT